MKSPVPAAPFTIRANGRQCIWGVTDETKAVALAYRMLRKGADLTDVTDANGWTCNIYERADGWKRRATAKAAERVG